jgi:transposase
VKTINNWIARARNEGWLGPAAQGRAGADPGPRLLEAKS